MVIFSMAKIDYNDIVGQIFTSNNYGEYKVLNYLGKIEKKHEYEIIFINTNNKVIVSRDSIKRNSCVDEIKKENDKKLRKQKEQEDRKRLNSIKGKEQIIWNKDNCRILAVDQALNVSGVSYFINDTLIEYGLIENNDKLSYIEKIILLRNKIDKLIDKYQIDILAIEDTYVYKNVEVYKKLSILLGTLQILAYEKGIPILVVSAVEWKKHACILDKKGRESQKLAGLIKIREKYGIFDIKDDVSDSILLGIYVAEECIVYNNKENNPSWE